MCQCGSETDHVVNNVLVLIKSGDQYHSPGFFFKGNTIQVKNFSYLGCKIVMRMTRDCEKKLLSSVTFMAEANKVELQA